uniref:Amidase domain-containing protein n=1 Tax=Neogobius melanostomus TaxID=47308 RepID=A0A8C6U6A4_9GOBI
MMEATAGALLRHWPEGLVGAVCLVGAVVLMVRRANAKQLEKRLTSRAKTKGSVLCITFYIFQHPTKDSTRILRLSLCELMEQLQDGSLSAEEVLYAYMEKTLELQRKLNCCTGIILDSFEQCKSISSCKKGLLYGVPISLKENLCLKVRDVLFHLLFKARLCINTLRALWRLFTASLMERALQEETELQCCFHQQRL